ncbi:MAG: Fe-S oxidoreductase [Candidatus Methanoperedens nitroreducens]|uniref:Fe-S oxidoreductase n=2 Tax=Candidatus Methanoperedens TaxID=1392997 RepID=A0A0P8A9N2_9EURY|nr:MAG: radical SAM protein [Candidatus Methanoperedens sp.]KPQ43339.1 MAG: Fe-S oxidoreductase [Candidatus Methanoperedens sp. BLZ1]
MQCVKMEKNTIILFNPMPVEHPVAIQNKMTTSLQVPLVNVPLSLLALGRMIGDEYDVKIINAVVDNDYKRNIIDASKNALCLAVSSMTCYQISDGIDVCKAVKELYPELPVIWGGYHPSTEPVQTLNNPYIDIVIRGQGEIPFKEAVGKIKKKESLNGIRSISYKEGGRIIENPGQEFKALDSFPPIQYDMIDIERHVKGYKFADRCIDYYSSMGCAAGCDFCSEPLFCGRRWSGLCAETVVSELEYLAKTYNIDTFMIRDSDFFINVKRVKEICRLLIGKNPGLRLTSVNGRMEQLSRMDDEVWGLLRKAGIHEIFIGFESGLQEALDAMNKGANTGQIKMCIDKCIEHDIDIRGSFMVGIPGMDAKEEVTRTFEEINKIISAYGKMGKLKHMDILLSFFTPYPHTKLYEASVKNGLKPLNTLEDWGDFDQFDFKAPWFSQEYFDITRDFRAGMPMNSGCGFEKWCRFYEGIVKRLERI